MRKILLGNKLVSRKLKDLKVARGIIHNTKGSIYTKRELLRVLLGGTNDPDILSGMFLWDSTKEGNTYWSRKNAALHKWMIDNSREILKNNKYG